MSCIQGLNRHVVEMAGGVSYIEVFPAIMIGGVPVLYSSPREAGATVSVSLLSR